MSTTPELEAVLTLDPFPLDGSIKTLAWIDTPDGPTGVIPWVEEWLIQPDGPTAGEPFRLTAEQVNFLLWFYAMDEHGRFIYRRATLRRAKGWGKSPFMGAIALAEMCGPVVFAGWDADGNPIGQEHPLPWVQIAGVSQAQTHNTYDSIVGLAQDPDFQRTYELDVGLTRILGSDGAKIEMITSSATTLEGGRPTFVIMDETHHWTESNRGWALAAVIRRNLAKTGGRSIETTNAHEPGEDSTAENTYTAYRAMAEARTRRADILYDSREAPDGVDLANEPQLREALRITYGDSTWVDIDRKVGEIYDPNTTPEESRRFYLNQIVAAANAWLTPLQLTDNFVKDIRPLRLGNPDRPRGWRQGDEVVLGFDGSRTHDSTALVAIRLDDAAAFLLGVWERPEGPAGDGWEVPYDEVRDLVDHAFAVLDVAAFFSDVHPWETDVAHWADVYRDRLRVKATTRDAVAWDMRGHQMDTTHAVEALHRAFVNKELPYGPHTLLSNPALRGDEIMVRHISNARRRLNKWGTYFGKENRESPKKVDVLAALVLAYLAYTRIKATGQASRRHGRVAAF